MPLVSANTLRIKQQYHQTFEIHKSGQVITRHTLLLNPQTFEQNEPARVGITQALGGAFTTDFGSGLPTVTIAGNTGYRQRYNADGELRDGYEEFKHFRNEIYRRFIRTNDPDYAAFWYNWEDEEYYVIQPTNFRLQRNSSEPTLYQYEFAFTCIADAAAAPVPEKQDNIDLLNIQTRMSSCISTLSETLAAFRSL